MEENMDYTSDPGGADPQQTSAIPSSPGVPNARARSNAAGTTQRVAPESTNIATGQHAAAEPTSDGPEHPAHPSNAGTTGDTRQRVPSHPSFGLGGQDGNGNPLHAQGLSMGSPVSAGSGKRKRRSADNIARCLDILCENVVKPIPVLLQDEVHKVVTEASRVIVSMSQASDEQKIATFKEFARTPVMASIFLAIPDDLRAKYVGVEPTADGTFAPPAGTSAPAGATFAPTAGTSAPAGATFAPTAGTSAPAGATFAPTAGTSAPAGATFAPTAGTSAPAGATFAPTAGTSAPAGATFAPTAGTSAPAGATFAPTAGTSAPAGATFAPTAGTSAPAGATSAPAGSTYAPPAGTTSPAGATSAPAGATFAPTAATSAPAGATFAPPAGTSAPAGWTYPPPGHQSPRAAGVPRVSRGGIGGARCKKAGRGARGSRSALAGCMPGGSTSAGGSPVVPHFTSPLAVAATKVLCKVRVESAYCATCQSRML
ncbi:unnamed protein product [Closterium sp. Naga37s-1]|nr:unnamed protein product [Closterium sp. Naga37s-1]